MFPVCFSTVKLETQGYNAQKELLNKSLIQPNTTNEIQPVVPDCVW